MDLASLKTELFKRLEYSDEEKEKQYQLERAKINDSYPDEGWRIPEGYINAMENLKKKTTRNQNRFKR
jgi:hypothetical protein